MPKYVALLRGINVGGRHIVRMADLRAQCDNLGFSSVATYLQSGNVVFHTSTRSAAAVGRRLEEAIRSRFGFEVGVVIRTAKEIASAMEHNPFAREAANDPTRVHVAFLPARPEPARVRAIRAPESGADAFQVIGREIYLHYPDGAARTKLTNTLFERGLGMIATARNWRTVVALHRLAMNG